MKVLIAGSMQLVGQEWDNKYYEQKMGYSLNYNPLFYMEPAGGIEPPTY